MIAAVSTVRNELDIVGSSIHHLLENGVDEILVADGRSTDGTRELLEELRKETGQVHWYDDTIGFHDQPYWIGWLAAFAATRGAQWIIPFDADEFWCGTSGRSIAEAIADMPGDVGRLYAPMYQHHDRDHREVGAKRFPKVAYRWNPSTRIALGNHDVTGVIGQDRWDVLEVREIQYQSFEHFVRKMRERNETIDPRLPETEGWHHRRLAAFTEAELLEEWERMTAAETVLDPIPERVVAR